MAIVQMQRINICALKKNRKAILERLQELGAMEIDIQLEDDNLGEKQDVASSRALFERRARSDSRPGTGNPEHLCSGEKRHAGFSGRQAAGRERTV